MILGVWSIGDGESWCGETWRGISGEVNKGEMDLAIVVECGDGGKLLNELVEGL